MDVRKRVGLNLQRIRRGKGLSQEELAHRARIHQTYLSGVEGGKRNPSIGVLGRIATALAVDIEEFFRRSGAIKVSADEGSKTTLRISELEIEAERTAKGGWTRATLAKWGVPWPPPKGWRRALIEGQRFGSPDREKTGKPTIHKKV
jgi:transcriptional regulator with XRE-family HTH domain